MIDNIIQYHKRNFQRSRRFIELSKKLKDHLKLNEVDKEDLAEIIVKLKTGTEENYHVVKCWLKERESHGV